MSEYISIYVQSITKKYFDFSNRASRTEYWTTYIFGVCVSSLFIFISEHLCKASWIFHIIPFLSVLVRRHHDCNYSGWFIFINIIPIIGWIWELIILVSCGDKHRNYYG